MVGVVLVSHSRKLAEGLKELLDQLSQGRIRVEAAGGTEDGGLGTDAVRIQAAVEAADQGDGVLVLMDLGSAVLSARTALEFLAPDLAARTVLGEGPLVEGAVAAAVEASAGSSLEEVRRVAEEAAGYRKLE